MAEQKNNKEYQELLFDNPICNRRFHVRFDPTAKKVAEVDLKCPHCQASIFVKKNHPIATLAREENLVKSADGSQPFMSQCYLVNR